MADTIFRTRENLRYCKKRDIHLNGPKLGKPASDPAARKFVPLIVVENSRTATGYRYAVRLLHEAGFNFQAPGRLH